MVPGMKYDFNVLERRARECIESGNVPDALKIYLFMADGDASLDAGSLGMNIGRCYEQFGDLHAAKYWYGRAVEENPQIAVYVEARKRLEDVNIDDIVPQQEYVKPIRERQR